MLQYEYYIVERKDSMVDQLRNFAQSYVRAAKEQGYSDENILMTVRTILEERRAKAENDSQYLFDRKEMEKYASTMYSSALKKHQYCPAVYLMEIPLQVMFIIHEKKYTDYLEFRRLVSINCQVEPPHVDKFVCGKNLSRGMNYLLNTYGHSKQSEWYHSSYQGRLSILEFIEKKIFDEAMGAKESG